MKRLIPIREFDFGDDLSNLKTLTCINHPTAAYYTKNPFLRSVHLIRIPDGDIERMNTGECMCPFSDLAVVTED